MATTTTGGLTRRRGGGAAQDPDKDEGDTSRVGSPAPKSGPSTDTRGPETSFSSGENGHKIAFDPRDISESQERSKQPKLTLMEEVLLIGLKDKQVDLAPIPNAVIRDVTLTFNHYAGLPVLLE